MLNFYIKTFARLLFVYSFKSKILIILSEMLPNTNRYFYSILIAFATMADLDDFFAKKDKKKKKKGARISSAVLAEQLQNDVIHTEEAPVKPALDPTDVARPVSWGALLELLATRALT